MRIQRNFCVYLAVCISLCSLTQLSAQERLPGTDSDSDYSRFASGNSIADTLNRLENRLADQDEEIAKLKADIKKKVDPGSSKATMKVGGRIHIDYWGFPETDAVINGLENPGAGPLASPQDRLGFRRMRFGVKGKLPANMEYKIEMEFAGGNNSEFRDVYLGWNDLPVLRTFLVGNQKRPYGLDHLNSSRFNVFIERPFVIESFNQDARRLGACSYGVSEDQAWNWRYGVYTGELMQNDGQRINDHWGGEVAGRLAHTCWYDQSSGGRGYAHWAISGTAAFPDGGSNETRFRHRAEARHANRWLNTGTVADLDNYQMIGVEGVVNLGPIQMVSEYQHMFANRDTGDTYHLHGGYVYLSYFLTGEHMPWKRSSGTLDRIKPFEDFFLVRTCDGGIGRGLGAWQVAIRWSYADFSDVLGVPAAQRNGTSGVMGDALTVGLNWYWTSNARMQFNWIHGDITTAAGTVGDYDIVGARFMVDF